jgi:hypothetical protein
MFGVRTLAALVLVAAIAAAPDAQTRTIDLSKETVGRLPTSFEPIVGTWIVAQDGSDKVIKVDGAPWKLNQDNPTRLLIDTARKLYGTSNEELMDNAKQFAYYPVALARDIRDFSNGTLRVMFKTISGDADRASGILFNVKPNGDWLAIRYNDTEQNVALWTFRNGVRRSVKRGAERAFPLDRSQWHELKIVVNGAAIAASIDGTPALDYTLGSEPQPGRRGAPAPDLFPANNPTLRPPVAGRVGLWSKTDSTSLFKDFAITPDVR